MLLGGPLLTFIGTTFGTWVALSDPSRDLSGIFIGIAVFGILLGIIGFFLLVAAAYRALVKIDALSVGIQSVSREKWPADSR